MQCKILTLRARPTTCALGPIPSSLLQTMTSVSLPLVTCHFPCELLLVFWMCPSRGLTSPPAEEAHSGPLCHPELSSCFSSFFLSKTLEQAASNRLFSFLIEQPAQPSPVQLQTWPLHGDCIPLLRWITSCWRAASFSSVLILLDLSAAFDTVEHSILLSSLQQQGSVSQPKTGSPCRRSSTGHCSRSPSPRHLHLIPWPRYFCSWFIISLLCWRHLAISLLLPHLTLCLHLRLRDIQSWMDNHLKLNPGKIELIFIPALMSSGGHLCDVVALRKEPWSGDG